GRRRSEQRQDGHAADAERRESGTLEDRPAVRTSASTSARAPAPGLALRERCLGHPASLLVLRAASHETCRAPRDLVVSWAAFNEIIGGCIAARRFAASLAYPRPNTPIASMPDKTTRPEPARVAIDDVSKAIIEQLQQDGRRSYAAIGKAVGLSEAAVRQRVQRLTESGVMQIVAVTDPLQLGFARQAM